MARDSARRFRCGLRCRRFINDLDAAPHRSQAAPRPRGDRQAPRNDQGAREMMRAIFELGLLLTVICCFIIIYIDRKDPK